MILPDFAMVIGCAGRVAVPPFSCHVETRADFGRGKHVIAGRTFTLPASIR
jgi:hypothetical protein